MLRGELLRLTSQSSQIANLSATLSPEIPYTDGVR
jgi:hypothetical protein